MALTPPDPRPTSFAINPLDLMDQLVTARAEVTHLKAQLETLRDRDALTGLPNRLILVDRTGQAILQANRQHTMVAMLYIELDRFKSVNQVLNFVEGDELVLQLARRMTGLLSSMATLARLGTDQFAVLLPEVQDPSEPLRIAQNLLETLILPFHIGKREVLLTASIGISLSPQDGDHADALQKEAEHAANRAKASGGNAIQSTTLTLSEASFERQQLESDLSLALAKHEMQIYYQPQVTLDGTIIGVEALLRWQHPILGAVPPSKFIPLAEENRLIHTLGEWALATACHQAAIWQAMSPRPIKLAVNVSPLQLSHPRWLNFVASTLRESRLSPACLELEITESTLLNTFRPRHTPLHDLKALGLGIGIDDFGTGYSSLSYLQRFPIDTLKIDQAFVQAMFPGHPDITSSLPIVQTIIDLGHNLDMAIVAEGVETPAQLETLQGMGCRIFQGYLTGCPMTAADLSACLETQISAAFTALLHP